MIQTSGVIICLGYILGLLFTAIPWGGVWILLLGIVGAVFFRRRYIKSTEICSETQKMLARKLRQYLITGKLLPIREYG